MAYYDAGFFGTDMVEFYRRNLAEQRAREWWSPVNPEYWLRALHADYVEYLADGAPRRPDYSHLPPPVATP